ncbi:hypothetical protein B1222_20900 [Paenibacillus larvae subsp. pulvifaciens]|uniref:hypothetical protein n=1 Tax=Paenibacillus larvae TaxID=1464 RepID=UPI00098FAA92|nr:hypothetical protein [Paenibacillus larvae]AQT86309.1 hypothetical protein B1222_20900 [Paenibacillus larvae subsp. pulvifaciens]AQZ47962.1 hypothetical protein B5S25_16570 [Paenibacillus larvae subsp. pulvifaciens]
MPYHSDKESGEMERGFKGLSPFELKNKVISLASQSQKKKSHLLLNAGRGNPNWTAAAPREAFFALGQFAVQETKRTWSEHDLRLFLFQIFCSNRMASRGCSYS